VYFDLDVRDFLDRGETVYGDRIAIVDEPGQPAVPLGPVSYAEMARLARAQAANLDRLGVPAGGRVAIVSHNAARFLISFFGVSGWGRILVPVNFRLSASEIEYILEDSGSQVVLVDPELESTVRDIADDRHVIVLGDDAALYGDGAQPADWAGGEMATATINYTSGTTARPKGVQLTQRNIWLNAVVFGLHTALTDDDVYLHTLPMFHANAWGMPFAVTGLGGCHVVLRKVDGAEILRRVDEHDVTLMCAAPAVVSAALDAAGSWSGTIPGRDRVRVVVAGAPPPTRTVQRVRDELGWEFIQIYGLTETAPLLTVNRLRSEWRALNGLEQARRLGRAGTPALGVRIKVSDDVKSWPGRIMRWKAIGITQRRRSEFSRTDGFTRAMEGPLSTVT
jgi:acyl-CoA synthetase (AMP-forming)/AMP-acid ligase II